MSFEISVRRRLGHRDIGLNVTSDAPVTALVGPSGAGKTSILNMIAGILRPDAGRIAVGGETLFDNAARIDLPPERRRAGYVFQDGRLFPHRDVRANLRYGERLAPPEQRWIGYDEVVALLALEALTGRWPATLSGGEARRVAIGRALLSGARFLLLDEPLTSLDAAHREQMLGMIERIRDGFALPILYVSHQDDEVRRIAGRIVHLPVEPT